MAIKTRWVAAFLTFASSSTAAYADEPLVGFTYTTDMLPKGKVQANQWITYRVDHEQGDFDLLQLREQFSYGIADDFQLSGYINLAHASTNNSAPNGLTAPPEVFSPYRFNPNRRFTKTAVESVTVEGIYRLTSPVTKPIGVALYVAPSVGPHLRDLDTRLILQKNMLTDRLVLAANLNVAYTWRNLLDDPTLATGAIGSGDRSWERETTVQVSTAASFRFTSNWNVGAEFRNEREFEELPFSGISKVSSSYYAGPSIHYGGQHMFLTLTALRQLPIASDYTASETNPTSIVNGYSNFPSGEKYRFRLKFGYYF